MYEPVDDLVREIKGIKTYLSKKLALIMVGIGILFIIYCLATVI